MKDKQLENAFDEYFDGVCAPNGLTNDAKKQLNKKKNSKKFYVRLTAAAASIAVICASAGIIGYSLLNSRNAPATAPEFEYYSISSLTSNIADEYNISAINSSLKFIEKLALGRNSSVSDCTVYSSQSGEVMLIKATVIYVDGLARHDTTLYAEFTKENYVCELYENFESCNSFNYGDALTYRYYTSEDNGEPVSNVAVDGDGIRYYFSVKSSDEKAYIKYLNLIIKN